MIGPGTVEFDRALYRSAAIEFANEINRQWAAARQEKNFKEADRLREMLERHKVIREHGRIIDIDTLRTDVALDVLDVGSL